MENFCALEITLISAQGLKEPSPKVRRMQTYALAWIDPSVKIRTCVDSNGGENPTWNDKFLFKVSPEFLSSETSGVSVEIFAIGVLSDTLLGTVRLLTSNLLPSNSSMSDMKTPSFNAFQVRRPSGRYQGILNVGATVLDVTDVPALNGVSAIGFRDLIGESFRGKTNRNLKKSKSTVRLSGEKPFCDPDDQSDGCDSTTSSSSAAARALKEWNEVVVELEGNHVRSSSDGGIFLCGLVSSPRRTSCLCPLMPSKSFSERKMANGRSRFC